MPKTKNKQSKWVIPLFFIVVFTMIVINQKETGTLRVEIDNNKGFPRLMTHQNELIAADNGGIFYILDWSDPKGGHSVIPAASDKSVLLNQQPRRSLAYSAKDRGLVMMDENGRIVGQIANHQGSKDAYIIASDDRKEIFLISQLIADSMVGYTFKQVNLEKEYLGFICDIEPQLALQLRAFSVSDSASLLAVAGQLEGQAYLAVIDINQHRVLWQRQYSDFSDFASLAISTDERYLFVGSEEGTVSSINATTGEIDKSLVLVETARVNTNSKAIQTIVTSPKGAWLACACDPEIFLLDQQTFTLYKTLGADHKIVTGMAFSVDEKKLATSDLRASGTINIIDIEQARGR